MVKQLLKYRKKAMLYFGHHVEYNAFVHVLAGIGLGILIASPIAFPHPVRWALTLLALSIVGHLYTLFAKTPKK
ncbi:MAG TPA: hypothetical protein VF820_06765 [Patescibacteria group bacterium]